MKKSTLKYIITGPPGAGKSTLIKALKETGFSVIEEVSRAIIIQEQNNGENGTPWGDLDRFNELVFDETKKRLSMDSMAQFCDRSLLDNIAYIKLAQKSISEELKTFPFTTHYHQMVFFAPPWKSIYKKDPQRPEEFEEHQAITEMLKKTYEEYGFKLVFLPLSSVKERVEFVKQQIELK